MSAFRVCKAHLDYLVTAGVRYGAIAAGGENQAGETLLQENLASLAARYGDSTEHESYRHEAPDLALDPVQVLKAARCLDYQSCEHDAWRDSTARKILDAIEEAAIERLPARMRELAGERMRVYGSPAYDAAEWEIRPTTA